MRRRADSLPLQLAVFSPGKIETSTSAASGLSVKEYEPGIWFTALSHNRNELPAVSLSAILYEVYLFMAMLTVHVLLAPSVYEVADARNLTKMTSKMITEDGH